MMNIEGENNVAIAPVNDNPVEGNIEDTAVNNIHKDDH